MKGSLLESKIEDEKVVCLECDKKTQKDLPSDDKLSSAGMPCEIEYSMVTKCMRENAGQISSCSRQWDGFKLCHEQQKSLRKDL